MRTKIVLIGAGGKMGLRLTHNLINSVYEVFYIEVNPQGIEKLIDKGITVSEAAAVIPTADAVIFAVPDVALGGVTETYIPKMKKGALLVTLDPAAALAGKLFDRVEGHADADGVHRLLPQFVSLPLPESRNRGMVDARRDARVASLGDR